MTSAYNVVKHHFHNLDIGDASMCKFQVYFTFNTALFYKKKKLLGKWVIAIPDRVY